MSRLMITSQCRATIFIRRFTQRCSFPMGALSSFVFGPRPMALISEIGVLGRWYQESGASAELTEEVSKHVDELFRSIGANMDENSADAGEILQGLVTDVLSPQITVFTPKGEPKRLPVGATPLDFAYKIHTQVGDRCRAALVNGSVAPLNSSLNDGDQVEIQVKPQKPHRVWLDEELGFLKTANARSAVRRHFRKMPQRIAIRHGQHLVDLEMEMIGLPEQVHAELADRLGYATADDLYEALGRAELMVTRMARRALAAVWHVGAASGRKDR